MYRIGSTFINRYSQNSYQRTYSKIFNALKCTSEVRERSRSIMYNFSGNTSSYPKELVITEMGPRDGLQAVNKELSPETKAEYINKLVESGINRIEIGSFVSPKIKQMANTPDVLRYIKKRENVSYIALVPTVDYAIKAHDSNVNGIINEFAAFTTISEAFSKKNNNCDLQTSFERVHDIVKFSSQNPTINSVSVHISCAFGCPFEGYDEKSSNKKLLNLIERLLVLGVKEIKLADTIGNANPASVANTVTSIYTHFNDGRGRDVLNRIGLHFHDPNGLAILNVITAFTLGATRFDASTGSIGGCNNVPDPCRNVSTLDLVGFAHTTGVNVNNINIEKLKEAGDFIETALKK